jgi:hypothetical protein
MATDDPAPKDLRSYSVILAAEVGEPAAQMFHRIWYFCTRTDSGKVIRGRRWIRNSYQQWRTDHFPHWGLNTVRRALKILEDKKLIRVANHNRKTYDNTQWYAVNPDHSLLIKAGYAQNGQGCPKRARAMPKMGRGACPKWAGGVPKMGRPIHIVDNKEDNQSRPSSSSSANAEEEEVIDKQIQKKLQARRKERGQDNGDGVSGNSGREGNVSAASEGGKVIPPPDPADDLLKRIYGTVPPAQDFLNVSPRSVDLWPYLRPFEKLKHMKNFLSKEEIRAMVGPASPALEAKCAEFAEMVCRGHFQGIVDGGFKVILMRVCRGGFLNRCGFKEFCERGLPEGDYTNGYRDPYGNFTWDLRV